MTIERARAGGIVTLSVNRPQALNALDVETLTALRAALAEAADDADARVVVLTGAGGRAFVAGADIRYMRGLRPEEAKAWGALGHEAGRLLETMPKPTIAAIDGFALGGGCELALACDLRVASPSAQLGQPEIDLGIVPGWGGTQRLARICGVGVAKDLIFTGRRVGADEALRLGLVHEVADPPLERAQELAAQLATKAPLALRAAKQAVNLALGVDHSGNLDAEADLFGGLFASEDAKEGLAAFLEKREPRFVGG